VAVQVFSSVSGGLSSYLDPGLIVIGAGYSKEYDVQLLVLEGA